MKNIIFDWSGVVKDSVLVQLWAVNRIFEKYGVDKISLDEFKQNWKQPYMLFYSKYLPNVTDEEQRIFYMESMMSKECPKADAFSGIVDLIKKLKENNNYLAVVSSDFPETLLGEIKDYGLENIFEDVITDVHDKTDSVNLLINKRILDKNNTYFIGDSNHEIDVSKRTGVKSVAVTWGFSTEEALRTMSPDFVAHNIKELEDILIK